MASGMARSHRGLVGIGERRVVYNPCGACEMGRCLARMLCSMLVDGRPRHKRVAGRGEGPIKGVMGRCAQATDPAPSPGAAARTPGGRSPAPARTRTGPTRDAAARSPQRRRLLTGPARARAGQGASSGPGRAVRWSGSLRRFRWLQPLVVDSKNVITAGHPWTPLFPRGSFGS